MMAIVPKEEEKEACAPTEPAPAPKSKRRRTEDSALSLAREVRGRVAKLEARLTTTEGGVAHFPALVLQEMKREKEHKRRLAQDETTTLIRDLELRVGSAELAAAKATDIATRATMALLDLRDKVTDAFSVQASSITRINHLVNTSWLTAFEDLETNEDIAVFLNDSYSSGDPPGASLDI